MELKQRPWQYREKTQMGECQCHIKFAFTVLDIDAVKSYTSHTGQFWSTVESLL